MNELSRLITSLVYVVPPLALVLLWGAAKLEAAGKRRLVTGLWVACAALAMLHYVWPHTRTPRYFNGYEHFHYYLGAKYASELGYTGLYVATVGALDEDAAGRGKKPLTLKRVRDLDTGRHTSPERLRAEVPAVKARFSPERWLEFRADAAFFADHARAVRMPAALDDKGYNAPPGWTLMGGAAASSASTVSGRVFLLPWIDVVLWLVAFAAIGRTFGVRPLAVTVIVLGTQLVTDHTHLKAAFLRVDWIVCLLLAMVAQRKQRPGLAGALVGYAAMMRVFPLVFAFGAGVKLLLELLRHRRVDRRSARFFFGMAVVMLVLFAASAQAYGLSYWGEFLDKIVPHASAANGWRAGFIYLFIGLADLIGWQGFYDSYSWLVLGVGAAMLIGSARVVDRLDDDEALAFGFFAFYLLVAPTYYYYVALLPLVLWFGKRMETTWAKAGLSLLLGCGVLMHVLHASWGRSAGTFAPLSVSSLVVFVYLWVVLRREQKPAVIETAQAPPPATP